MVTNPRAPGKAETIALGVMRERAAILESLINIFMKENRVGADEIELVEERKYDGHDRVIITTWRIRKLGAP